MLSAQTISGDLFMKYLSRKLLFNVLAGGFVAVFLACVSAPGYADAITLSNSNSTVLIDPTSQSGMYDWIVDGKDYLAKQWFWYRIDSASRESPLNTLPLIKQIASDTDGDDLNDTAFISYGDPNGLSIKLKYILGGGNTGSGKSDVGEQITITNKGNSTSTLHFFQYADFNLSAADDTVRFPSTYQVIQTAPGVGLSETVVTNSPQYHEAATVTTTLDKLNDAFPTTLLNNDGPISGDVSWAFQWDIVLAAGNSFIISKDKTLDVPEPSVFVLLVLSLGCMGFYARKLRGR
jgi:hypothetical protein